MEPGTGARQSNWRCGGFASHAHRGDIETDSLLFEGEDMLVNADLENAGRKNGRLEVEVLDEAGEARAGFERSNCVAMRGDGLDRKTNWRGLADIGSLAGETVQLRAYFSDGDLYAVRFGHAEE